VRRTLSLLLTLAAAGPLWAASLKIPAEVPAQPGRWLVLSPDTDCVAVDYVGYDGLEPFPSSELKDPRKLVVQAPATAGRFRFTAIGTLKDELARCDFVVVVGDAPPGPAPGPGPGPGPPNPPTPVTGLHALVLYESAELTKLPAAQQNVLYAKSVRDYLNAHTPAGPDGKTHQWRMYDWDTDVSAEAKDWQALMARKPDKAKLPWLIIAGDKGVLFEGPLPVDADAMLKLLAKYGG
jgi:hypothetical protein